jgi:translation elongation factor P/translation initiation factor 5A
MTARDLRKGMVIHYKGEEWRLTNQKCHIISDGKNGVEKGVKIQVDNHRRNKWMAKRLSDGHEQLFCPTSLANCRST